MLEALPVVMGNPGLGRGHFWRWLCQNVAETVTQLYLGLYSLHFHHFTSSQVWEY
jgi:hypothetical protein